MKANKTYRSLFSLLLVLAVLVSCIGTAFAANAEDETVSGKPATKGVAVKTGTGEMIVADWVHDYTIVERGADKMMADYAKLGITDVYLLVKGTAGKVGWTSSVSGSAQASNGDILKSACTAAKKYGIRVHAWLMAGHDDNYLNNIDSGAMAYHFRVGYGSDVNQRINLRDQGYRDYTAKLVKELVTNYDIAGIHLDCIRYFELYYDWGQNARDELLTNYGITIDQYNAATKAMCKRGGYSYTMKTASTPGYNNGASYSYVAYAASGTSASGNTTFATVLGSSSYGDAYKGAQAFMELRTDTVTGFVETVKEAAGDGIIISCAIMPEPIENTFSKCLYGQDAAKLGEVCDYITPMAYATQYQQTASWPASLSEKCAALGANVVTGVQAFNETYVSYASDLNAEIPQILAKAESVNANSASADILGYAFFRGATMTIGNSKFDESSSTLDLYLSNQTNSSDTKLVLKLQNGMTVDTAKLTNGMSNKTGFASGASFSVSSDKKTITITNGGSSVLSALSSATLTVAVKGTPSTTYGAVQLTSYKGSSYSEGKSFCVSAAIDAGVYDGITKGTCSGAHTDIETWTDENGKHFAFCYNCLTDLTEACVVETATTDGYTSYICVGGHNQTTGLTDVDAHSENGGCGYSYIASASLNLHFNADSIANDTADWNAKAPHSMTGTVDTAKGILYGTITGSDPYIAASIASDDLHYNISGDDIIELRIKTNITNGSGKGMQVFFTTTTQTGYNENYSINKGTLEHATGKYEIIQFPFNAEKEYIGQTLTSLRIDPLGIYGENTVEADYEIDYIYVGPESGAPSVQSDNELYFSFDNDAVALSRYNGIVYGGRNFDKPDEGYWAVSGTGNARNFSVDNQAGTLNATVGADADSSGVYGIWLETTTKYGCYPWYGENHQQYYPLNFNPIVTDYVQIRLKLNGCEEVSGEEARVYVTYDYLKDGKYVSTNDIYAPIDMTTKDFQTITIPVSETFCSADLIKSLGFRFKNIKSSSDGTVIIDYIHVGTKDSLYFDFTNTEKDQNRYSGKTYGDNNFDTGNWYGRTVSVEKVEFDNEAGTVSFTSKDATQDYHYIQTSTGKNTTTTPLSYVPNAGDSLQIRFKIEDAKVNGAPAISVHYMTNELTQIANNAVTNLTLDESYLDGEYHTVNLPLAASFTDATAVTALRVGFNGISSAEEKNAKFTIDYIYVGQKESMPRQNKLFFDFTSDAAAKTRYATETYGGNDFDIDDNWAKGNLDNFTVADGFLSGDVTKAPWIRPSLNGSVRSDGCVLQYQPGADDYLQIRFMVENSTATNVSIKPYYYTDAVGDWTGIAATVYDLTSGYMVATLPLAGTGFTEAELIKGVQVAFNGVTDGKLTVDYLYVGPKDELPVSGDLFFDFTNKEADQKRYSAKNYGSVNWDNGKNLQWKTLTTGLVDGSTVMDNTAGILTATSKKDGITSICVDTTANLIYDPGNAETVQVRAKLEGFAPVSGKIAYVNMQFLGNDGFVASETANLTAEQLSSGEYLLLNLPVTDEVRAMGTVTKLRLYFGNVAGGTASAITVDSIYVGTEAKAPIHDQLFFDFTNTEADQSRYATKTYGNVNFDVGNWKNNSTRSETPIYSSAKGEISTKVVGASPYLQTVGLSGSMSSAPLTFTPNGDAGVVQLRLKLTDLEPVVDGTNGQIVVYFMTEEGYEVETDISLRYTLKEADLQGEYFTVNLNAVEYLKEISTIYAIRVVAANLWPANEGTGEMTLDYVYVGSRENAPSGQVYFVDFMADESGLVAQHTIVASGSYAEYTGSLPEKESDEAYHYSFIGWKDAEGNPVDLNELIISEDIKLYPNYKVQQHSLKYTMVTDESGSSVEFHSCTACDYNVVSGHVWDEGKVTAEATCTEDGVMTFSCTLCTATKTGTVAASGHSEAIDAAVPANCTDSGLTEGSHCETCGEVLVAQQVIPATGHALEYCAEKAPTCTEDGNIEHYVCGGCGKLLLDKNAIVELPASYVKEPALGHANGYEDNGDGTHDYVCGTCGAVEIDDEKHSFVDGSCICGAKEATGPIVDENIYFGEQLALENDLTMTFRLNPALIAAYDISTLYLEVERDIYGSDGSMEVVSEILSEYVDDGRRLVFSLTGIAAAQMNDEIRVTLHIKDAQGQEYVSPVLYTSVTVYLRDTLSNMPTGYDKLYTLIMDMLNYGTAAQNYFGRHTDAPANEAYEIFKAYESYATTDLKEALEDMYGQIPVAGATAAVSQTLDLGTRIGITYKVLLPAGINASDAKLVIKDAKGNELETIDVSTGATDSRGRYIVNFYGSSSRDMRRVVYATVMVNGVAISNTYTYSISTYAYETADDVNASETLLTLTKAMVIYGDSAEAYFG